MLFAKAIKRGVYGPDWHGKKYTFSLYEERLIKDSDRGFYQKVPDCFEVREVKGIPYGVNVTTDQLSELLADSSLVDPDLIYRNISFTPVREYKWNGAALVESGSASPGAGSGGVPYYVPAGEVFVVPLNFQAFAPLDIVVDGDLIVDGELIIGL